MAKEKLMTGYQLHWLSPEWLYLLPLLWLYLFWQKRNENKNTPALAKAEQNIPLFHHSLLFYPVEQSSNNLAPLKYYKQIDFWSGFIISALILAIAEPIFKGEKLPDPPPERDIIFLVDTSVSMQLKDYQINGKAISRMDLLRQLLDKFAKRMQGERISVIIFGEQAYKLIPLTKDQYLIRKMLQRITTSLAGRFSDIGGALLLGLQEANKVQQNNKERHQTFILFSDADESRGKTDANAAAMLLAEYGIPLFTIAIGSNLATNNISTNQTQGGLYQAVNIKLFEQLSEITAGKSYRVEDSQTLEKAIADISKLRQNSAIQKPHYIQIPLYFYPLFFGLLLLFLRQFLSLLRSKG